MNERTRIVVVRALPLAALAVLLALLLQASSLEHLLPAPLPFPLLLAISALLVAPALFATRSPLPAALAVTVPVLAAASYDQSRLDWLRTLKDFGVAKPIGANLFRVAVELATLVLCFALHAADHAVRLRASALERGVPRGQARASMRLVLARSVEHGALAAGGAVLVGAIALATAPLDLAGILAGRAALLVPLVAIGLVAGAALLLMGTARDESSTDER